MCDFIVSADTDLQTPSLNFGSLFRFNRYPNYLFPLFKAPSVRFGGKPHLPGKIIQTIDNSIEESEHYK